MPGHTGTRDAAGNYVAALKNAEANLAEARTRRSGGWELVGRLWNSESGLARAQRVALPDRRVGRRDEGQTAALREDRGSSSVGLGQRSSLTSIDRPALELTAGCTSQRCEHVVELDEQFRDYPLALLVLEVDVRALAEPTVV